jgi:hypothetical protein
MKKKPEARSLTPEGSNGLQGSSGFRLLAPLLLEQVLEEGFSERQSQTEVFRDGLTDIGHRIACAKRDSTG